MRWAAAMIARTPTAMPTDQPLMWLSWPATWRIRSIVVVPPPAHPEDDRDLAAMISTAIPASTPVITGVDKNSEIHPRRQQAGGDQQAADQQGSEGHRRCHSRRFPPLRPTPRRWPAPARWWSPLRPTGDGSCRAGRRPAIRRRRRTARPPPAGPPAGRLPSAPAQPQPPASGRPAHRRPATLPGSPAASAAPTRLSCLILAHGNHLRFTRPARERIRHSYRSRRPSTASGGENQSKRIRLHSLKLPVRTTRRSR